VDDIGKSFTITVKVKADSDATVQYGMINAHKSAVAETVAPGKEVPDANNYFWKGGNLTVDLAANEWTTLTYNVTVTEDHVKYEMGMLGFRLTKLGDGVKVTLWIDDLKSVESVPTVNAEKDRLVLGVENERAIGVVTNDKPVADESFDGTPVVPVLPNVDASFIAYQVTRGEEGKFSLRAIAGLDSLNYKNFGYEVTITTESGTEKVSDTSTKAYSSIYGGTTEYTIKEHFGYKYGALVTITELALDSNYKLEIRAFVTKQNGEVSYGRGVTLVYEGDLTDDGYPLFSVEK